MRDIQARVFFVALALHDAALCSKVKPLNATAQNAGKGWQYNYWMEYSPTKGLNYTDFQEKESLYHGEVVTQGGHT